MTRCDLVLANSKVAVIAIDIFPRIFPQKTLVYDGHKVLTVVGRRISFCLLGCRIQP